ncbi:pao retrotransposon peptidase superfamily [Plakobranchus ocellatus]|uniref:Pao retrotransposon peptidase superfamily n=1 Tax=Plakobranchus ocellatus TaxID=259542 RepID=A0AAV4DDC3_9GAST|nr:pao retrotransposon peptidase superfamily [Plakobranchus ocellatus]
MDTNEQVRHMRFNRVTFGNASSPFILNAVIKLHLERYEKDRTIAELMTNLYVDDWLTGSESACEDELLGMMARSEVLQQGGFPLTKWTSYSSKVREILHRLFADHDKVVQKILGLTWCTGEDCFKFETAPQASKMYTKPSLLGLISRQFDPLGLLTFFTVSLKIVSKCLENGIAKAWIRGDPCRWKQFVRNRVGEIQSATNPACWHHCPGKENPADLLTRGVKASFLMKSELWLHGPGDTCNEISDEELEVSESDEIALEKETRQNAMLVAPRSSL